jgi:hypothetical protein
MTTYIFPHYIPPLSSSFTAATFCHCYHHPPYHLLFFRRRYLRSVAPRLYGTLVSGPPRLQFAVEIFLLLLLLFLLLIFLLLLLLLFLYCTCRAASTKSKSVCQTLQRLESLDHSFNRRQGPVTDHSTCVSQSRILPISINHLTCTPCSGT